VITRTRPGEAIPPRGVDDSAVAIAAYGIVKTYGSVRALDGVDLHVPKGTVLGLLGSNGAGKTTLVGVITTLLRPDAGRMTVGGIDALARPQRVREIIGVSGQYAAVDEHLTGFENLEMIGRLYHLGARRARRRARTLLERFALTSVADRPARTYSGGMRRRLDLAGALVADPPVIVLDEPTTGLDPQSRQGMWEVISKHVRAGATVLLTTQYLEEADQFADAIVVIDHGRVIARGTPTELKQQVGGERVELVVAHPAELEPAATVMREVCRTMPNIEATDLRLTAPAANGIRTLTELVRRLDQAGLRPTDLAIRKATLDDAFLKLIGTAAARQRDRTAKEGA
jgi:ABC-2 type transport system ATP-binding protein